MMVGHLVALAREESETGLKECNDAAITEGLGEGDLYKAKNWTRVIFPIFLRALDKLIEVKEELRRGPGAFLAPPAEQGALQEHPAGRGAVHAGPVAR